MAAKAATALSRTKRPHPPAKLLDQLAEADFCPAPEINEFVQDTFLEQDSKLYNEDHAHLFNAIIGFMWTNVPNSRRDKTIVGMAEIPKPPTVAGKWEKARYELQLRSWFGDLTPDFVITIDANYAAVCPDIAFCSLIEHELYHCGQKLDEFGGPKFKKDGSPVYSIVGHDVEEFVGIVRRYGAKAGAGETARLIAAAKKTPLIGEADVLKVCGSCK
ncbi:MAG: putative metallopeptidase [Pyrinomonadaceae bacterium]